MAISEKRKKELINLASSGKFNDAWAKEVAMVAINEKEVVDAIKPIVRNLQKHMEKEEWNEVAAVPSLVRIGEIAVIKYKHKFYMDGLWHQLMDVPTRYACGQMIARELWEH